MPKEKYISQWSLTLLRLYLGVMFAFHGYMKLFVAGALPATVSFFSQVGIPMANYSAVLVAFIEFFGGLLLIVGVFTRFSVLVLLVEMLVAFLTVHLQAGFFISPKSYGYEFILLIITSLIIILLNGAGKVSLGKLFKNKALH